MLSETHFQDPKRVYLSIWTMFLSIAVNSFFSVLYSVKNMLKVSTARKPPIFIRILTFALLNSIQQICIHMCSTVSPQPSKR